MNNPYLEHQLDRLEAAGRQAQADFGGLSPTQLNWKPSADRWSVGQCLDHLIVTNEAYFSEFSAVAEGRKQPSFWERLPWWPAFVGRMLVRGNAEGATSRFKNPAVFNPAQSDLPADIVGRFRAHNEALKTHLLATDAVNHRDVIITSPAGPYAVYSLQDAVTIIVLHEFRHLAQARRVVETEGFPR